MVERLRIVHVASEAVPVAKTGGLADVAGALPAAQAAAGHEVAVVVPCYRRGAGPPDRFEPTGRRIPAGEIHFDVLRRDIGGVCSLLLDAPRLFERPGLYGARDGDYPDNPIRFAAFARGAVRAAMAELGRVDLFHCHDWQAALVPQLLGTDPLLRGEGAGTPAVLTIHNLAYQGSFEPWVLDAARLPRELFTPLGFELYGRVNFLKGGILAADALTTVSPTYAREILTVEHGCGLHEVLGARRHLLEGILNGL
ncbi:MAG TPA: glycogen synthase GlgA, partial [Acidobacteria bacterium]|nr:glycogen synthase GlgA [Acidobacteriota bacterium]